MSSFLLFLVFLVCVEFSNSDTPITITCDSLEECKGHTYENVNIVCEADSSACHDLKLLFTVKISQLT